MTDLHSLITTHGLSAAAGQVGVAGVLFTYRCTITCRHCLFGCAAIAGDRKMTPGQLVDTLKLLHATGRVVHVAGGEAMHYWETLAEGLRLAQAAGCAPHFIETNCSFAVDDAVTEERLTFLAEHGLRGLLASADPYHQEFVPPDRFLRARRYARAIFGERNFWGPGEEDAVIAGFPAIVADPARLRAHVRAHPPVMVGSAWHALAQYLAPYAPDDQNLPRPSWRGAHDGPGCRSQFRRETLWELHIDPYGNIQTNCGIILGHISRTTPAALLAAGPERANTFVELLCESGPCALTALAIRDYGFQPPTRVTQTCDLCYQTRKFLRDFHPEVFGPAEVYASGKTKVN